LLVLLPVGLAILVGTAMLLRPREYTATTSFVPQEVTPPVSGLGQLATQFGLTARPTTSSPQFYAELLETNDLLREVATTTYRLSGDHPFTGDMIAFLRIREKNRDEAIVETVRRLRSMFSIDTDRLTGLVRVEVSTRSRELSVQIARRLLELLSDYNLKRRQTQARAEREFVEQRLSEVRSDLTAAEQSLAQFLARNRRVLDSPQLSAEEQRLQRQVTLRQQVYLGLAQNYEAAKVEEVRNTPLLTVVERPDSFVVPKQRGTIKLAILAMLAGVFLAIGIAFFREYVGKQRREGYPGYEEFVAEQRAMVAGLRKGPLGRWKRSG
jgi:uncharacterized protein involved in exopolysaccharide biosynthesis